jgi:fatty-acyl-CoA synthase
VAVLAPNVPALLAAHFAVLLVRGALVAINTRLNESEVGYVLDHSGAKVVFADPELAPRVADAPGGPGARPRLVNLEDPSAGATERVLETELFRVPSRRARLPIRAGRRRGPHHVDQLHLAHGPPEGRHVHAPRRRDQRSASDRARAERLGVLDAAALPLQRWCFPGGHCGGGTHVMLRAIVPDVIR